MSEKILYLINVCGLALDHRRQILRHPTLGEIDGKDAQKTTNENKASITRNLKTAHAPPAIYYLLSAVTFVFRDLAIDPIFICIVKSLYPSPQIDPGTLNAQKNRTITAHSNNSQFWIIMYLLVCLIDSVRRESAPEPCFERAKSTEQRA
jgi:hypothetical protein